MEIYLLTLSNCVRQTNLMWREKHIFRKSFLQILNWRSSGITYTMNSKARIIEITEYNFSSIYVFIYTNGGVSGRHIKFVLFTVSIRGFIIIQKNKEHNIADLDFASSASFRFLFFLRMKRIMPTITIIMVRNVTNPTRETTPQTRVVISYSSPKLDSSIIVTLGDSVKNT